MTNPACTPADELPRAGCECLLPRAAMSSRRAPAPALQSEPQPAPAAGRDWRLLCALGCLQQEALAQRDTQEKLSLHQVVLSSCLWRRKGKKAYRESSVLSPTQRWMEVAEIQPGSAKGRKCSADTGITWEGNVWLAGAMGTSLTPAHLQIRQTPFCILIKKFK